MSENANTCVVCYKTVTIYSIGMCEHPVCYECSTRMRVLCRQNECPICRQDLPKVAFVKEIKPFRHIRKGNMYDSQYGIYFADSNCQEEFYALLAHSCKLCQDRQIFSNFNSLKDHMRRKHELHYCDLCVEDLKIFSHERRCYNRQDLAQHRRKGDVDDKSHKGHPLCEFCDQRYMDNDELYRHLRRDHLYCHFCDADGLHQYYSTYDDLRHHFRSEHYLCEEGTCVEEKFTHVFRTDIDLRAHISSVHGKLLSKAAAKQTRTLELEFTLAPRNDYRNRRNPTGGQSSSSSSSREQQKPSVDVQSTDEFPRLSNTIPVIPKNRGSNNVTICSSIRQPTLAITDDNFPALGPETTSPNVSIQMNPESNGGVIRIRPGNRWTCTKEDFPTLKKSSKSTAATVVPSWVNPSPSSSSSSTSKGKKSDNGPRKRTELKIPSLTTNPPPGFKSMKPTPPPGFSSLKNGLTFTNSSGQSYTIIQGVYTPPPDFQKRNKSLVARVNEILNRQENIEKFRHLSAGFRQGIFDADNYYEQCQRVMGKKSFEIVFPELLVLLPDIEKQQQLFQVYKNHIENTNDNNCLLKSCDNCGQIVKFDTDYQNHRSSHNLDNHFPVLQTFT